jgi:hypothetical protein
MPTFMMSLNFTDQGIRNIKDAPKRAEAARDLAKKLGVEVKHLYLTAGESDLVYSPLKFSAWLFLGPNSLSIGSSATGALCLFFLPR